MLRRAHVLPLVLASLSFSLTPAVALASDTVYVANYANSRLSKVDFDALTTTQINTDANKVKKLSSMFVRNDGNDDIIICDTQAGIVRIYENVEGPGFDGKSKPVTTVPSPDGISADSSGNLYLISSGPGNAGSKKRKLWFIEKGGPNPGGYSGAHLVREITADLLEDTKVVKTAGGELLAGDILVLSRKPGGLLRYRRTGPLAWNEINGPSNPFIDLSGLEPMGLAFSVSDDAGPELLVLTLDGNVLRYDFDGDPIMAPFLSVGLGNGTFKIATGVQDRNSRAFITQRNGHKAYAFNILSNGRADALASVSQGLNFPQGVGIGTGNGQLIAKLPEVIATFLGHTATVNDGRLAGIIDSNCRFLRRDPRVFASEYDCNAACTPVCVEDGPGWFCPRSLSLSELDSNLAPAKIPSYMRFFRVDGPAAGDALPFLCTAQSSARFNFASILFEADDVLNWPANGEPQCGVVGPSPASERANFAWTPIPGSQEPKIYEGDKFINMSTGCGNSNRGDIDDYSYYFPLLRDTRPLTAIAESQLVGIRGTLDCLAASIYDPVETSLRQKVGQAAGGLNRFKLCGDPSGKTLALQRLGEFQGIVTGNTNDANCGGGASGDAFNDCDRNVSGELLVRANSAVWIISNATPPSSPDPCCSGTCNGPPTPVACPF